jgi:hypothetical protein
MYFEPIDGCVQPQCMCYSSLIIVIPRLIQILRAELDAEEIEKSKVIHIYEWSTSRAIGGTSVGSKSSNLIFIDSE